MKAYVYPYKMGSESAKALSTAIDTKRVKPDGIYNPKPHHVVVNWGSSKTPNWWAKAQQRGTTIMNAPAKVKKAINKTTCLDVLKQKNVDCVKATTTKATAQSWLDNEETVVVRTIVGGHGGEGIVLVKPGEQLPTAPLYTKYTKKKDEFRIHVFNGKIIDMQEKRKQNGEAPANMQIRNHTNGWVFCRENVEPDQKVLDTAKKAVKALGLDFAAVDIGWNSFYKKAHVYELNCAPGLEGTSVDVYKAAVEEYVLQAENY